MTDDLANYEFAIAALRLRAVVRLDVIPHPYEWVDLILLLCVGGKG